MISFEDFKKIDLRAAKIVSAEKVEGTDKLLKLILDLGGEERQIISGIAEDYPAADLVGREIVIVANLEPRSFKGVESNGMLLAAEDGEGGLALLQPDKEMPPGTPVH